MYTASAALVRAGMSALHTDLTVDLRRMYVSSQSRRERAARVLLNVSGFGRVTGQRSEWDLCFCYVFSPRSGKVELHRIESIDPAPHTSVYEGMKAGLMRVLGKEDAPGGEGKTALEPARAGECKARSARRGEHGE
ncbi:hypothetical protein DACRYDRAFT_23702 [Dacryopinax primogenitus]|uniref:Uncharacterized protein n=1 Tax=Dacryopinax primogenitus (strain DJM 731) TaxID=1858805 RepID=M5FTZ6_DACPD|nr:uncharacterized protein DACRYDRAFT_23702 [Dacryopinax primogenitus]EJT99628.1 hypothetical protein DACRYDRAFT_23702 [Dacryopinax primogenitus]